MRNLNREGSVEMTRDMTRLKSLGRFWGGEVHGWFLWI